MLPCGFRTYPAVSFIPLIDQTLILSANPLSAGTQLAVVPQSVDQAPMGKKTITLKPGQQFRLLGCSATGFYVECVDSPNFVFTNSPDSQPNGVVNIDLRKGEPAVPLQHFHLIGNSIVPDSNPSVALTVDA